ncbi:MAG: J domain-containing protein [Myxococcota bacterium]
MAVDEAFQIEVQMVLELMEHLDYYQLLKIPADAPATMVQKAFFRESRAFHPDRYYGVTDETFKSQVLTVYKRLAEAYGVLKDPETRAFYDQQRARDGGGRLDRAAFEAHQRQQSVPEAAATTPNGRKFLSLGLESVKAGNQKAALLNLQLAISAEPENTALRALVDQLRERMGR